MVPYKREMAIGIIALVLTDFAGLVIPWLLKYVIDRLPQKPPMFELLWFAGSLFLIATFQGFFRFGWRKYLFGPSRKIERDLLNELFSHFLKLDKLFYQNWKVGDLMSRATNDLRSVRDFMGLGLLILMDCLMVITASFTMMLYINPQLMVYCLIPLPALSILFYWFSKAINIRHRAVQERLSNISSMVQENLAGIRVLRAYVQEELQIGRFQKLNRDYLEENMKLTRLFAVFTPSLSLVIGISALIALWIGGKAVIANEMSLGSFVAFNGYLMMLSWPMMGIGFVFNLSQKGLSAMTRIEEILFSNPNVIELSKGSSLKELERISVKLDEIEFSYPGESGFSLKKVNLDLEPGKTIALIGSIGSGKSTFAKLIPRLLEVDGGELLVGGQNVRDIPLNQLRSWIGYVDQGPYLFSDTIRNNITFGHSKVKDEEIRRTVSLTKLGPDIETFPNGMETFVGERGVSLSGGQKQRIALARALLGHPRILILDDAFSNLDVETEEKILFAIRQECKNMATLIITHRLSTVRNADEIVVMERGRIVERGCHRQLASSSGYYGKILKNQMLTREMELLK